MEEILHHPGIYKPRKWDELPTSTGATAVSFGARGGSASQLHQVQEADFEALLYLNLRRLSSSRPQMQVLQVPRTCF